MKETNNIVKLKITCIKKQIIEQDQENKDIMSKKNEQPYLRINWIGN